MITQVLFLFYLFLLGLSFGLFFKKWIPFNFIVLGSFLWGSVIFSLTMIALYMLGITIISSIFLLAAFAILFLPLVYLIKSGIYKLKKSEWLLLAFVLLNFVFLNLVFLTFNFSMATYDSFVFLNIARSIGFFGFNPNVIDSLTAWGVLIPILHSAGLYFNFDYLATLQFSFSISFIALFYLICQRFVYNIVHNSNLSKIITSIITLVLISTPLIFVQFFYIHSNQTTGFFLFLAIASIWFAIEENNNFWFIFSTLAFIGMILSRTETFLYVVLTIIAFLTSNHLNYRQRLLAFLPTLIMPIVWFLYMLFRLSSSGTFQNPSMTELFNGSKFLNPTRILLVILFFVIILTIILFSRKGFLTLKIFPFLNKYFVLVLLVPVVLFVILRPAHMGRSLLWFFSNLYLWGYWGFSSWLITFVIGFFPALKQTSFEKLLINISLGNPLIIIALVFLRNPFRMGWSDSANRLMTMGIPIGLLLSALLLGTLIRNKIQDDQKSPLINA